MAIRIAMFLLIALGLGGIGVTAIIALAPSQPAPVQTAAAPAAPKAHILVAARTVRGGTLLVPEDLTAREVAPSEIPEGAWTDSLDARSAVRGAMVRHLIEKDQPIRQADVVRPGERGFLAAVLAPGARAATIAVDAVSGTAGLIWPGDRVDVLLTQKLDETKTPGRRVSGETVLQNVRVIAVDQHMTEGEAPGSALTSNISQRTVTLEVSPKEAEKVSVAASLGRLALVIRSATEAMEAAPAREDPVVWASDVSGAFRATPGGDAGTTIRLFPGAQAAPVEYHY
jgi:pilus assembly protein CpaB